MTDLSAGDLVSLAAHASLGTLQRAFSWSGCFVLRLRDLLPPDGYVPTVGRKVLEGAEGSVRDTRKVQQGAGCRDGRDELQTDVHKGYLSSPGCEVAELRVLVELRDKTHSPFRGVRMALLSTVCFVLSSVSCPPSSSLLFYFD